MLRSQLIKGSKEKFFINQIFDENIRRLHQGNSFSAENAIKLKKKMDLSVISYPRYWS